MASKNRVAARVEMDSICFLSDTTNLSVLHPTYILLDIMQNKCKQRIFVFGKPSVYANITGSGSSSINIAGKVQAPTPLLVIHGSIMYEGFYQSNIDTPFIQKNIYQHSISAALQVTVKDRYPLHVRFTTRFSNAPFLKSLADVNFQFSSQEFKNRISSRVIDWQRLHLPLADSLNQLGALLLKRKDELNMLRSKLSNPLTLQKLVEEREAVWMKNKISSTVNFDSLQNDYHKVTTFKKRFSKEEIISLVRRKKTYVNKDSTVIKNKSRVDTYKDNFLAEYNKDKKRLDSIVLIVDSLQAKYAIWQKRLKNTSDSIGSILRYYKNPKDFIASLDNKELPDSILPKGYRTLLALRSVGIGRSTVNFSELSLKNISINGIEAEYNPFAYLAIAAGAIDYHFRDFIIHEPGHKQYVTAFRFGTGMRDGNHLFITYYAGRKQLYNYGSDSGGVVRASPDYNLMGWTLEGRFQLNKSCYFVAEAAKSSMPFYKRQLDKQNLLASAFSFNDRSNEAYAVSLVASVPSTSTKINATYKKIGANFQSFSLFTTSSAQAAWAVQVAQPFFKKALLINACVKKNDYTNPYINQNFYTNTIFKSVQATLRLKNLPVISAGYYPSSQLTKLGTDSYTENLFYTLVITGSHFYKYKSLMMSTLLSYTRFYNKSSDSNFVYFNTNNILLGQTFLLNKATLQFNLSGAKNAGYSLYTAEGGLQYKLLNWLIVGGDVKYNRQTVFNNIQVGYGANTTIKINKLGDIQFMLQKGYLPGPGKQLVQNDIGRLVYYKIF